MYEMLLIWFFCIVFFATSNIILAITRKPVKQAIEADCAEKTRLDWLKSLPEYKADPTIESQDETDEVEIDETEDEDMDETPKPVIPRTGKVTMLASNLAQSLNIVKDSVATRTTLPIVLKVLIAFKDGSATFTTTNLETAIVTSCGCRIESEFTCLLPFRIMKDLSEALYDDIVVIEKLGMGKHPYKGNVPIVTFTQTNPVSKNKNVVTLFDDDPQCYPPMPKVEGQSVVIGELSDAIKQVKDKIIKSEYQVMKYCGLFFDLSKPNIVATDGKRMKISRLECEPKDMKFRIDRDCALILAKFKDIECLVTTSEKQTRFDFGLYMQGEYPMIKTTVITQNLMGDYPDYEALKESHKEMVSVL